MNPLQYFFLLIIAILLFSCEKVIDVNVDDATKKYVIEGVLTNEAGGCQVKVSKTKAITDNNNFIGVAGAQVRIIDEAGVGTSLIETRQGIYQSSLIGIPGKTYTLQVTIGGETFTGKSQMPQPVLLDSLYMSEIDMMGDLEYYANVVYTDPEEKGNAYRFVQYINGVKNKDIFVQNDDLTNDRKNTNTLFNHDDEIKKGAQIRVEMQTIDQEVYKYWYSLRQSATGDGNAASPANPVSNLNGGALGYFSVHAQSSKTVTVE
jgi:hypothetical protein